MKLLIPMLLAAALAAPLASAQTFDCSFPRQGANEWIRSRIVVTFTGDQVTVFDSLINQEKGGPIPATVQKNTDTRLTLRWKLKGVKTSLGYGPSLNYSLSYFKQRNKATANLNAPGIDILNAFGESPEYYSAQGTCQRR
ncbi:hypothetical protein BXY66_1143 [Shimia isoporae]|uniref:Uncharacterized protein n=1 Tax=Shimia isoporae TaxID=647720 RepID=A0A4V2Q3Z8_9RHOB|nr:hypothetical protein [Shimia isoporae]TCL09100.1 hypothetical protein BXY66_1143 [Shimia isoporae]